MQTVISFPASGIPQEELAIILSDYLALDRARIFRRRMVAREWRLSRRIEGVEGFFG